MSLLQDYVVLKNEIEDRMEGALAVNYLLDYQELAYRVCVLETLKTFSESVPDVEDEKAIHYYGKALAAYLKGLADAHKFAPKADKETLKKRETALNALCSVCEDAGKKIAAYTPSNRKEYAKDMAKMIKPVTIVWAQYRNTLVAIGSSEKAEKPEKEEKPKKVEPKKTESDEVKQAMQVSCPIKKFAGMTLGEVLRQDAKAIQFLATKYEGKEEVRAAAKTLCEYAIKQSA